jgi:hypothetical protein
VPVAAAVNVAVDNAFTAAFTGFSVITGPTVTVSVAAVVVAEPTEFVNTARYWFPFCPAVATKLSVVDVAPATLLNDVPPSVLTCHCTVGVGLPLAAATNVTFDPALTLWLVGFVVTAGAKFTVIVAAVVVADPLALVKTARNLFPFWLANTLGTVSVVVVAPATLLNDVPPSVLTCH